MLCEECGLNEAKGWINTRRLCHGCYQKFRLKKSKCGIGRYARKDKAVIKVGLDNTERDLLLSIKNPQSRPNNEPILPMEV